MKISFDRGIDRYVLDKSQSAKTRLPQSTQSSSIQGAPIPNKLGELFAGKISEKRPEFLVPAPLSSIEATPRGFAASLEGLKEILKEKNNPQDAKTIETLESLEFHQRILLLHRTLLVKS